MGWEQFNKKKVEENVDSKEESIIVKTEDNLVEDILEEPSEDENKEMERLKKLGFPYPDMTFKKYYGSPISMTSQFYFCPIPLRLDTYSGCSHGCFTKGQKILKYSKNGIIEEIDISKIKKGDIVVSFSNKLEKSEVVYKNKRYAKKLIEIETESGKKIIATEEHPIFTKLGGWVEAEDLKIGDKVLVVEQSDKQYLKEKWKK